MCLLNDTTAMYRTDIGNMTYSASPAMEPFGSFPAVLGHEILARVVETGPEVRRVEVGQRVAVDPMLSCEMRGRPTAGYWLTVGGIIRPEITFRLRQILRLVIHVRVDMDWWVVFRTALAADHEQQHQNQ